MKKELEQNYILQRYSPSVTEGLKDLQVNERVEHGLTNVTKKKYSKTYLRIFLDNICTVFNLLGLIVFAALLCINSIVKITDYFFVLFYIANIAIGITQEIRAKKCVDKLSLMANKNAKVIRNGKEFEINLNEIVLDDVIKLGVGDQIPTDSILLEGNVEVNEAFLTGESNAVKKKQGDDLFAGSFIVSGNCFVRADKIGKDNYVETLSAKAKQYKRPHSEIMSSLTIIIRTIICFLIPIALAWIIKTTVTEDLATAIYKTSTPVIGMIPAGMFLLTSVTLAIGIVKLAKHNTLVQDLYSLEMLARVDTICFDKTGTITDGNMTVTQVDRLAENVFDVNLIMGSMLNTLRDDNQTALALNNYFGQNDELKSTHALHFSSARKLSAVTFENLGTFSFGAPEYVLNDEEYQKVKDKINEYALQGLRVLIFAHSNQSLEENYVPNDFSALAILVIADNVRDDAIETVKWFKENNVQIKVISGDNPVTVAEVSKRVGIDGAENYISLDGLTDEEVYNSANKFTVFGRVSPEQKAILIKALKDSGHVTAMTGDGVNDILALKEADCAISVASGSDAARNVSHLVLMDNNFSSMPKIVYEGRRVINNVQSSASLFLMKTIFTIFMSVITLFLPYMNAYPYKLSNMIMFEMFVTGIPSFFLSFLPNKSKVEGNFIDQIISKSFPAAVLMVMSVLLVELARIFIHAYTPEQMIYETMGIYVLTYAGVINLYVAFKPFNKSRTFLYIACLTIILGITYFSLKGVVNSMLSLAVMLPIVDYWHHLLIVIAIILLDIPLVNLSYKLCSKINLSKLFVKKK